MPRLSATPKIYFVRHGQSLANSLAVVAGSSDSPLTERGIEQAQNEADLILQKAIVIDTIIASSLSRALDTAKIIARRIGVDEESIVVTDLLQERSLGSFEGGKQSDFYALSEKEREDGGCEKLEDLQSRVRSATKFVHEHASGNTLVVGHSGFYRMARCIAEKGPVETTYTLENPKNSSLLEYPL